MASQYLNVAFGLLGDGATTTFVVDLGTDPIFLISPNGQGMVSTKFDIHKTPPNGVFLNNSPYAATLSGLALTLVFNAAPAAGPFSTGVVLTFPA